MGDQHGRKRGNGQGKGDDYVCFGGIGSGGGIICNLEHRSNIFWLKFAGAPIIYNWGLDRDKKMLDSRNDMRRLVRLASGIAAGVSSLYWLAAPALATLNLCDNTYAQGVNASGLCGVNADQAVQKTIQVVMFVAFVAALLFLIYGGIRWVISGGDKENTAKAKGTVTAALIGLALVVGSWVMLNILLTFFGARGGINGLSFPTLL